MGEPTLDCQDCGRVLLKLNPAQAAAVAERPYDFIRYCRTGSGCRPHPAPTTIPAVPETQETTP